MTIFFFDFFIQNAFFHCFNHFFIFFVNVLRSDDKQNDNIHTNIIHDDNFKLVFFIREQFFYSFVFYVNRVDVFFCRCSKFKIKLRNNQNVIWKIARNWTKIDDDEKIILLNFFEIITQSRWLRSIHLRTWNVSSRWDFKYILLSYIWI